MKITIGTVAFAAFIAIAMAQLAGGYAGIAYGIGHMWAIAAVAAAVLLRFTLPITVGAVFGAMHVWGWHWALALLFATPGLVFMFPGVMVAIFSLTSTGLKELAGVMPASTER